MTICFLPTFLSGWVTTAITLYFSINAFKIALNVYTDYNNLCAQSLAGIGETYRLMGRYKDAKEAFQKLIAKYPDSPQANAIRNMIEAVPVDSWQKQMEDPGAKLSTPIIHDFLAGKMSQKELQDSLIAIDGAYKNDALYVIGLKFQTAGEFDKAKEYYQKCIGVSIEEDDKDIAYDTAMKALEYIKSQKR